MFVLEIKCRKLYLTKKAANGFTKTTEKKKTGDGAGQKQYRTTAKSYIPSPTPAAHSLKDFNYLSIEYEK